MYTDFIVYLFQKRHNNVDFLQVYNQFFSLKLYNKKRFVNFSIITSKIPKFSSFLKSKLFFINYKYIHEKL